MGYWGDGWLWPPSPVGLSRQPCYPHLFRYRFSGFVGWRYGEGSFSHVMTCLTFERWTVDFWSFAFLRWSAHHPCWVQEGSQTWRENYWRTSEDLPTACDSWRGPCHRWYLVASILTNKSFFVGHGSCNKDRRKTLLRMFCQDGRGCPRGISIRHTCRPSLPKKTGSTSSYSLCIYCDLTPSSEYVFSNSCAFTSVMSPCPGLFLENSKSSLLLCSFIRDPTPSCFVFSLYVVSVVCTVTSVIWYCFVTLAGMLLLLPCTFMTMFWHVLYHLHLQRVCYSSIITMAWPHPMATLFPVCMFFFLLL